MNSESTNLLTKWHRKTKIAHIAYTRSATYFERIHYWLGGTIIVLSTIASTSIFATSLTFKIVASIASIAAAILAGFQTFYRLSERAEKYRLVSAKYGDLSMEIELCLSRINQDQDQNLEQNLQTIFGKLQRIREEAPTAPQKIWDSVRKVKKVKGSDAK